MENATPWIEHLKHPLVLFGFVLLLVAGLLKLFHTCSDLQSKPAKPAISAFSGQN